MRTMRIAGLGCACLLLAACGTETESEDDAATFDWTILQDTTDRVAVATGFAGPEAVRYDPDADVYFVSNFNGGGNDRDANGFISRVGPDGSVDSLRFMVGTEAAPLHAPRGMFIIGDTLWAADVDGVHGFDRRTGAQLQFVDMTAFEPGFLNDVAAGPDGAIYVTDTGESRIYRIAAGTATVPIEDSLLGPPNGITWDPEVERFLLAPWGGVQTLRAWQPGSGELTDVATSGGGFFDGIEIVGGRAIVASQADSSLHVIEDAGTRAFIRTGGRPADIGVDTRRNRVAVPYISLDRVDIWALTGSR